MIPIKWLKNLFSPGKSKKSQEHIILPMEEQIKAWYRANRKMLWDIKKEEFNRIQAQPSLTDSDIEQGFIGVALFYGYGDDGHGHADSVLSGKIAWDYACKRIKNRTWQTPYVNFDKPDAFRLRLDAPPRPRGFYSAGIQINYRLWARRVSVLVYHPYAFAGHDE